MDEKDKKIISILRENARAPLSYIAKSIGISVTAVKKRIAKMQKNGVIKGFKIIMKEEKNKYKDRAYLLIMHIENPLASIEGKEKFEQLKHYIKHHSCNAYEHSSHFGYIFYIICPDAKIPAEIISHARNSGLLLKALPITEIKII